MRLARLKEAKGLVAEKQTEQTRKVPANNTTKQLAVCRPDLAEKNL
jgi:hypothetical protein